MQPRSVSYVDIQKSGRRRFDPLRQWKQTVESQQDLYLPCGVKCLDSLRQAMIIEELTLFALACAVRDATVKQQDVAELHMAQKARMAKLKDLRRAAAQVALIGEYYRLKGRSVLATYVGVPSGILGTVALVLAFV